MRLAFLECFRQRDGNRARHLLDLIEKERAARGEFQAALVARIRPHDGAEELLLQDLRRRIAAAQRDERARRAWARLMDAVRHALLARAGLALDQHVVLVLGHAGGLRADARKRRAFANHRVEAVLRRVARSMRDERAQVLDGHRDDDDRLDSAVSIALERHDRRDVLIRLLRRDPRDFFIVRRHAVEALVDRRVLIVHDDIVEVRRVLLVIRPLGADALKARVAELIGIGDLASWHDVIDRKRCRVEDCLLGLDADRFREMCLERVLHRQEQRDDGILRHRHLLHRDERDDVVELAVDLDGCRAGIAELALLDPHLRAEHPERRLMRISNADARSADILDADAHALDLARRHLIERQRIALEHAAFRIDEQQREIVLLEEFADVLADTAEVVDRILVLRLERGKLLLWQFARHIHLLRADAELPALHPRLRHPRMDIRVEYPLFYELAIIALELLPAAMFPYHVNPPLKIEFLLLCDVLQCTD